MLQLGRDSGIPPQRWYSWFRGENRPTARVLNRATAALDVPLDDLIAPFGVAGAVVSDGAVPASLVSALERQTEAIGRLADALGSRERGDPGTLRDRRRYWLERAQRRLRLTSRPERLKILGWPTTRDDELGRIERGEADIRPDQIRDFARAYRIPESVLADPPETDDERLEAWAELALAQIDAEPARRERRTA